MTLSGADRGLGADFLIGVNLPWLDYGCDFGTNAWQPEGGLARPERRQRLAPVFESLAARGIRAVRWFMLGDGRAGIRWGEDGCPLALDDRFFPDVDSALDLARAHGLRVLFTLIDFLWFRRPRVLEGVRMHGRRPVVHDARKRGALLDRVFGPLLERYGHDDTILAWDVINEPEWATFAVGTWDPRVSVSRRRMRAFIGETAALVHSRTGHPVTVGAASAAGLGLLRGLGLDFYQVHWYDSVERRAPLERPVSALGLDRPVLLGEYPTAGSARSPESIVARARESGYAGAFAWSVLADDSATDARLRLRA
jgi:hypothetical protein